MPDAPARSSRLLARATRARTLPIVISPVAVGAALAYRRGAPFRWDWLGLTLAGVVALYLGANAFNEYYDERSGADKLARIDRASIPTGSGVIASGAMSARKVKRLGVVLFAAALAAGIALGAARGWTVLILIAAGVVLAWQHAAPPLRYSYRGRGLGELGTFVASGVVPLLGAYYAQAKRVDGAAAWATIVPGLLMVLVAYHDQLLHWRADKGAGKMTTAATFGPEPALIVSGAAIVAVYVILTLQVAIDLFPVWTLVALISAVPLAGSWSRAFRDPLPQNCLNLLGATLGANVLTGVVIAVSLIAAR